MKRVIVLLIIVGLIGLASGCKEKTTIPGIRPTQQFPKK